jgi:phenylpropionate dioxygenase-like ring-hydroxylating dioxygenase large terminal subunit
LGGRWVFVQRFGRDIRGFENVCPHRSYPLRTADKGNGPVVCGFHHWHYDRRGHVVGIPICKEMFGTAPRNMPARLRSIEIALCGSLVFGRFSCGEPAESLEQFLGDGFALLASISTLPPTVHPFGRTVEANWRLMMNITLDDYHIVAVHNRPRHQANADLQYHRFGLHSALVMGIGKHTLQSMAADREADRYRSMHYKIFNIFPNLAVSLFRTHPYWYANIQQFVPVSAGRSKWRGWFYPTIFPVPETALERRLRRYTEPIRARIVRRHIEKIAHEDHAVCERLQEVAHQAEPPILGAQEVRVGWFQEAYEQTMGITQRPRNPHWSARAFR